MRSSRTSHMTRILQSGTRTSSCPRAYPLDSLLKAVVDHDFGILVLSPDDVSRIRGATAVVPRGNVVFEAALFMGKHGRDRCFLVQPRDHPAFARPTDLEGIIAATYDEKHYRVNPSAALGPACTQIRNAIKNSASFNRTVTVVPKLELADPATSSFTYPKKLAFGITNSSTLAVTSYIPPLRNRRANQRTFRSIERF